MCAELDLERIESIDHEYMALSAQLQLQSAQVLAPIEARLQAALKTARESRGLSSEYQYDMKQRKFILPPPKPVVASPSITPKNP